MLGIPESTAYDLRFRLLGIPVRVHPFFWLGAAIVGFEERKLPLTLLKMACMFVSILVHEYGHGLMSRAFGLFPSIVLHGMGGLCISEAERQTPRQRLAVLICGPGAGFAFFALLVLLGWLVMGIDPRMALASVGIVVGEVPFVVPRFQIPYYVLIAWGYLLWINLWWGLINLLPIWPLDGGQIAGVFLTMWNRREGMRRAHVLSLVVGGVLAVLSYQRGDSWMAIFFALFAMMNFQILQALHNVSKYGVLQDDEDWWRR